MGLFDWLGPRGRGPDVPIVWHVYRDGGDIVAEDGRGTAYRAPVAGARNVRIVPLTGGNPHMVEHPGGWQVALARADGDVLVGKPLADWRMARDLARQVCDTTELPLDELTERLFSQVGQYAARDTPRDA